MADAYRAATSLLSGEEIRRLRQRRGLSQQALADELGMCMTGSTYAALPMGPQLNNYRDLVDEILKADPARVQPLNAREEAIMAGVAKTFPTNKAVFDASL